MLSFPSLAYEGWLLSHALTAEKLLLKKEREQNIGKKILNNVLEDFQDRVDSRFHIQGDFKKNVLFWAKIYTRFSGHHKVIHDKKDLSIVYGAVDTKHSSIPPSLAVRKIRKSLIHLSEASWPQTKHAKKLQHQLIEMGVRRPPEVSPKKFFADLAKNLRVQTGQRDKIFQGILNSRPFLEFFYKVSSTLNLPRELLAIAFVESSFNLKATSKVGASGVWQIMPHVGKKLLPWGKNVNSRRNIMLSTVAALHLLAQNFKLLKQWDLAITAYNFGTKNIMRAQKKLKKENIDLAYILKHYRSNYLGFASKNFYSAFLALAHILKYKELFFPLDHLPPNIKTSALQYGDVNIFISKCGFIPQRLYSSLARLSPRVENINNHLTHPHKIYPRGTLLLADAALPPGAYHKISQKDIRKSFPKNYYKLIRKEKCLKAVR